MDRDLFGKVQLYIYVALKRKRQLNGENREIGKEFHTIRTHLARAGKYRVSRLRPKTKDTL